MKFKLPLMIAIAVFGACALHGQEDMATIKIAADTLSSELQEDGLSVASIGHYNDGLAHMQNSDFDLAILSFSEAVNLEPSFSRALYNRAAAYLQLHNYAEVISDLSTFIERVDTANLAFYLRARAYHIIGNTENAIKDYTVAIAKGVERESSNLYSAEIYFKKSDYIRAEECYSGALRENSNNAAAFHDRGSARKLINKLEEAAADYNEAIRLNPRMTMAYLNLASVYRNLQKLEESLAEYHQAVRLEPENVLALNNRGYVYFLMGKYTEAEKDFREAIRIDPQYAFAHNNLAGALIKQERFQEAIPFADKAIALNKSYGMAYLNRGIAREMVRDVNGACADWETAEQMNVKNAGSYKIQTCKL